MDSTQKLLNIQEVQEADEPRIVEIINWGDPEPITLEQYRMRETSADPTQPRYRRLLRDDSGEIIGYGSFRRRQQMKAGLFMLTLHVVPAARREGIGTAFLEHLEAQAKSAGGNSFMAFAREEYPEIRSFADRRGYGLVQHLFESVLDLSKFEIAPYGRSVEELKSKGVEFRTFAELGDSEENRRKLHDVMVTADKDTPGIEYWGVPGYEQFDKDMFRGPMYVPEAIIVALVDGAWAGLHNLAPHPGSDDWSIDFTGVRPEFRGRGIATAMKVMGMDIALSRGAKSLMTHNDAVNKTMLGINQKFGFVSQPGWLLLIKEFYT